MMMMPLRFSFLQKLNGAPLDMQMRDVLRRAADVSSTNELVKVRFSSSDPLHTA